MTFGAMPAAQAWLLLGGAAALAAWLFLRKLRPPRMLLASLLLWRRVLDEPRALTIWERIRRAVSLVLTVAIALALALAATRPGVRSSAPAAARERVLIVIDSSWSMLARTRSGESRWERAVAQARRLAAGAGSETAVATTADGLVQGPTLDATLLDAALDRIAPAGGDATAWPRLARTDTVHFITDGGVSRRLPADVIVHSVFEAAPNVGVTAFDVRPSLSPGNTGEAYLEIANFAPLAQTVDVTLARGEAPILNRQLTIAAGQTLRQVLPLGRGGEGALQVRVDAPRNALPADDEAFAWIQQADRVRIAVVGQQTGWLRPLLLGNPDVSATFVDPSKYDLPAPGERGAPEANDREALIIFDRWAPQDPPARPAIYIAPPADVAWLRSQRPGALPRVWDGSEERQPRWEAHGTHPVVAGVDPLTLAIEKARAYGAPGLTAVARSRRGTPLVLVSDTPARRFVVVAFGPDESNLASAPGFPVLMGNAIDWLARPDARAPQRTGLSSFNPATARVTGPGGRQVPLMRMDGAVLGTLRTPGLYVAEGAGATSRFAVNVSDPQVSNTARTTLSPGDQARAAGLGRSERPWWMYCAAAAFVLALAEWWTWQRRITV